jgi:hypothetical protein
MMASINLKGSKLSLRFLAALVLLATGTYAHADTFSFSYSGVTDSYQGVLRNDTFDFQLDSSSLINGTLNPFSGQITYIVQATVNGVTVPNVQLSKGYSSSPGIAIDTVYINNLGNGQGTLNYYYYISYGIFLSGALDDAMITPGSYSLVGENYLFEAPVQGTLTITDLTPASAVTPEPSSFVFLGTGLLSVAGFVRKRFA